jgi:hypothetical protein
VAGARAGALRPKLCARTICRTGSATIRVDRPNEGAAANDAGGFSQRLTGRLSHDENAIDGEGNYPAMTRTKRTHEGHSHSRAVEEDC